MHQLFHLCTIKLHIHLACRFQLCIWRTVHATSSSGEGMRVLRVKFLIVCLTIFSGYRLYFKVVFIWLSSTCLLLCVLGNVCALYIRVLAVLIFVFYVLVWIKVEIPICMCRFPEHVNFEVVTLPYYKCI